MHPKWSFKPCVPLQRSVSHVMGRIIEAELITQRVAWSVRDGTRRALINITSSPKSKNCVAITQPHTPGSSIRWTILKRHWFHALSCRKSIHIFFDCFVRYRDKDLRDNYCRNPDNRPRPWCYTMDPKTPWEFCNITVCGKCVFLDNALLSIFYTSCVTCPMCRYYITTKALFFLYTLCKPSII